MKCEICGRHLRSGNHSKRCSVHAKTFADIPDAPPKRTFKTSEDERAYKRVWASEYRAKNREACRESGRKYSRSEKGKATQKAYRSRPDIKALRAAQSREYHQRPEVKERNAARARRDRARKKAGQPLDKNPPIE
ncbi:MAG: hypothetical protein ISN29_02020 [Gammaproteobacteria bacterium AqS3]|nr:hypothetical protein [Gammaproteobacteria bacterium AqS3]